MPKYWQLVLLEVGSVALENVDDSSYILIEFHCQSLEILLGELWSLVDVIHDYDETTYAKVSSIFYSANPICIPANFFVQDSF